MSDKQSVSELAVAVARLSRWRGANHPETLAARDALGYAMVEARIRKAVDSAPPLPDDVRENLKKLIDAHSVSVS